MLISRSFSVHEGDNDTCFGFVYGFCETLINSGLQILHIPVHCSFEVVLQWWANAVLLNSFVLTQSQL